MTLSLVEIRRGDKHGLAVLNTGPGATQIVDWLTVSEFRATIAQFLDILDDVDAHNAAATPPKKEKEDNV